MGQGDQLEIVLIGAGNVATHLGRALAEAGHHVVQVYSRTSASAQALADVLQCGWTADLDQVTSTASLYILSVRDEALPSVAAGLYASLQRRATPGLTRTGAGALFVHTAGCVPLDVLPMLRRGVFYPMQTFSRQRPVAFEGLPVFVESLSDQGMLFRLAESLGARPSAMDSQQRKYLHLAAVFTCNFTNHLYDLCAQLLVAHDIPFDLMLPLIDETAAKVHAMAPRQAQTGPAVRADEAVMRAHMNLLPEGLMRQIYSLMSQSIQQCALDAKKTKQA